MPDAVVDEITGSLSASFSVIGVKVLILEINPLKFTGTVEFYSKPKGGPDVLVALAFTDSADQASGITFDTSETNLRLRWDVPCMASEFRIVVTNTNGSIRIYRWVE